VSDGNWVPGWFRVLGWDEYRFAHRLRNNRTGDVVWVDLGVVGPKFVHADAFVVSAHRVYDDLWVAVSPQFDYSVRDRVRARSRGGSSGGVEGVSSAA
jgi:hypothetical protein